MDRVESAESLVSQFSPDELNRFSVWFADFQDARWEKRIEKDSESGKLDHLVQEARVEFDKGRAREL